MSNLPAKSDIKSGLPTQFEPEGTDVRQAQADAVIVYAKRVMDWTTLKKAVDKKMSDQAALLGWWEKNVRPSGPVPKVLNAVLHLIPLADAEKTSGIKQYQISRWSRRLKEPEKYREMLLGALYKKAMGESTATASKWTGDPENYTPAKYIVAALTVMGSIDLDPASCEIAQKTVKADIWFGDGTDGLDQEWRGHVFLNPPYNFPLIASFIDKLCDEYKAGHVTEAVLLTNNNTDTAWWHQAAKASSAVCFTAGRINFYKADGSETQPTNGQTFFYFGGAANTFADEFNQFGLIMERSY